MKQSRSIHAFRSVRILIGFGLILAACGGSESESESETESESTVETTPVVETTAAPSPLDFNGDGKVVFGVAVPGPRDDGAYYQALVDKVTSFSSENGFEAPIIVDNIKAENATADLSNLAEQGVDIITVGASEIADPLADLTAKYADIFWYCNCGAGYPTTPGLAQSQDDSSEISFTAGYATGLLMKKAAVSKKAVFIGCCDLGFEKEAYLAYEMGLKAVDPAFSMSYIGSGGFPYDFDNTAGATEAFNNAVAQGIGAVYPYLGGAHESIVKLANEKGIIVNSAGSSKVCERTDMKWDIATRFDAGDYLSTLLAELTSGTFKEGDIRVFHVGVDKEPGAVICGASAEDQAAMDAVYTKIAAGDYGAEFGAIKGKAYSGG